MMECTYCNTKLHDKKALNKHVKNTKYCIKIRELIESNLENEKLYREKLYKELEINLENKEKIEELNKIITNYQKEILDLKFEIYGLKKDLDHSNKITNIITENYNKIANNSEKFTNSLVEIAKKSNNIIKSNNDTFVREKCKPIPEEVLFSLSNKIDMCHLKEYEKGIGLFINEHIIKIYGLVLDNAKTKMYKWIDSDNNIINDDRAKLFINKILKSISQPAIILLKEDLETISTLYNDEQNRLNLLCDKTRKELKKDGWSEDEISKKIDRLRINKYTDEQEEKYRNWDGLINKLSNATETLNNDIYRNILETISLYALRPPNKN